MVTNINTSGVLASWASALFRFLEAQGLDAPGLFKQADVDPAVLKNPTQRIPALQEIKLWFLATQAMPSCPHFGLNIPKHLFPNSFHSLPTAMQSSSSLRDALECLVRSMDLFNEALQLRLIYQQNTSFLRYDLPEGYRDLVADAEVDAAIATLTHTISGSVNQVIGMEFPLFKTVYLQRACPGDATHYQRFFGCKVLFKQAYDQIEIENWILDAQNPAANDELASMNEQMIKDYISKSSQDVVLTKTLAIITRHLRNGDQPQQDQIASEMHMSLRQMQRRLQDAGESYSNLLKQVRHVLACEYLKDKTRPISRVSQDLGFTDQSNFTKAFKRWESMSPVEFRKRYLAAQ